MALWKDSNPLPASTGTPATPTTPTKDSFAREPERTNVAPLNPQPAAVRAKDRVEMKESVIASDLTIEGKIVGTGHVRIAGRFKGDVNVQGDLSIESGAHVTGSVRADKVLIAGELVGNIDAASHVELMKTGALTGDLKAASLSVAAGSRMRGQAEFGWEDSSKLDGAAKKSAERNRAERNGADHGAST